MKILYAGFLSANARQRELNGYSAAGEKLQKGVIDCLEQAADGGLHVLSVSAMAAFPRTKELFPPRNRFPAGTKSTAVPVPFFNVPVFKQLTIFISALCMMSGWAIRTRKEKDRVLVYCNAYAPVAFSAFLFGRLCGVKVVALLGDPPIEIEKRGALLSLLDELDRAVGMFSLARADGAISVTRPMAETFTPGKPYIDIGIGVDPACIAENSEIHPREIKRVAYTGWLHPLYNIQALLDAAVLLGTRCELLFYGRGPLEALVKEYAKEHPNIRYMGYLDASEITEVQRSCDALVVLSDPDAEFYKYSFSSKTFEYWASGRPVVTTRVKCLPEDLLALSVVVEQATPAAIAEAIERALGIPEEARAANAEKTRAILLERYTWEGIAKRVKVFLSFLVASSSDKKEDALL